MASKEKGDVIINMSQAELKLIALGTRFSEGGKVDYEKIAKFGGYTKGSAAVLYRKALRKLTDAYPIEGDEAAAATSDKTGDDPATTPSGKAKTPKTPRSRNGGRKRKDGAEDHEAVSASGGTLESPFAPGSDISMRGSGDSSMETPTKKPKVKPSPSSFTSVNRMDDNDFLKDEPLFEPMIKME